MRFSMLRLLPAIILLSAIASAPGRAQTSEQCFLGRTASRYGTATRIQGNAGTNDPGGQLQLGRKTNAAGGVLSADSVQLGPGSRVAAVAANSLGKKKATIAQEGPATLPLVEPFCPVPAFACGGQEVSVAKNKTMELAPGAYGAVTLQNGADLVLGAGTYELCALRGGKKATIAAGPSTVLNVQGTLVLGKGSQLGPSGGEPFVVNLGGGAAKLGAKSKATAVLSAPGAALDLGANVQWRGGFCAATIRGAARVRLDCAAPPPTTTTTSTSPTTTSTFTLPPSTLPATTTTTTTTTTQPVPAGCFNGAIDPGESCDDANTVAGDGCTGCSVDPVICSPSGIQATVSFLYNPRITGPLSAGFIDVGYSAPLSIPGTGTDSSVRGRLTRLLPDPSTFRVLLRDCDAGNCGGGGVRASIFVTDLTGAATAQIPPGPVGTIRFDCTEGTQVHGSDLPCTLDGLADGSGQLIGPDRIQQENIRCVVNALAPAQGGSITTTTSTTTSTSVTVAPTTSTTSTTTAAGGCGNREITSPETCDDGNVVDEDFCPSDCKVDFCQPTANEITALVTLSTPDVAALTVFIDYPEGQVNLQGVGGDIPPGVLVGPGTATTQGFDFDHALRIVAFDVFNFGTTTMATVKFNGCQGSPAPQAQDFTCRLEGNATDESFAVVPGVTCSVTLP